MEETRSYNIGSVCFIIPCGIVGYGVIKVIISIISPFIFLLRVI